MENKQPTYYARVGLRDIHAQECINSFRASEIVLHGTILHSHKILLPAEKAFITHLPFQGVDIGCQEPSIAEASQNLLLQGLHFCKQHNIKKAVMHAGYNPLLPSYTLERWIKRFLTRMESLLHFADTANITLLLENTYEYDTTLHDVVFRSLAGTSIRMCLDTAHVFCFSKVPLTAWLDSLGSTVEHLHLSDNDLLQDLHLAIGKGKLPWTTIQQELKELSAISRTLEVEPKEFKPSVQYLSSL